MRQEQKGKVQTKFWSCLKIGKLNPSEN